MQQTHEITTPKVRFSPLKMVYDTIRVKEVDFKQSTHIPPFEIIYFELAPGDKTPKDKHADVEIWIILTGCGRLIYDGRESLLQTHDMVQFAPNHFHQIFNEGQTPLLICSLSWLEAVNAIAD